MATTNRTQITELDFDSIKNNLKAFLSAQSEFKDYNFEGSGLSVLLDILAYNTHYNAYYLNMVANEAFLDTSVLRDSVVSHAKTLGYVPFSYRSSKAIVNITVNSSTTDLESLTIPRGTYFKSNLMDFTTYNYVLLEDVTVTKSGYNFLFENIEIFEGELTSYVYNYIEQNNPKAFFTIQDSRVDTTTIKVTVQESQSNTSTETYNLVTDVLDIDGTSNVYFLQEGRYGKYQIYFGDGIIGKKLNDGAVVKIEYLTTNGSAPNSVAGFVVSGSIGPYAEIYVDCITPSSGGASRETISEIKFAAPSQFTAQNRLITTNDYVSYIKKQYPIVDSISVWGGEEEIPPVFGKVFVSIKPKDNYYITETEKSRIVDEIIAPKSIITVKTEIRDPEYLYVLTNSLVRYKKEKTTLSKDTLTSKIKDAIITYKDDYLNKFDSIFVTSKLQETISLAEQNAILGVESTIKVQKRVAAVQNTSSNYTISFNVPLLQGTGSNKLISTEFVVYDQSGTARTVTIEEVPKSYTGLSSIDIINPGSGYTTTPTVTITGDGFGAVAVAVMKYGKVESIKITNPGIDYTRAVVTVSGNGFGASALAVIDSKMGNIRTVYYNANSERQIVNSNAGTIDYDSGIIYLNDINIISVPTTDGMIRFNCGLQTNIIQSNKNTILTIDETDPSAFVINPQTV